MKYKIVWLIIILGVGYLLGGNLYAQDQILLKEYQYNGKKYYITLEKNFGVSEIWARQKLQTSILGDIKIASLKLAEQTKKNAMAAICSGRKIYDNGKLVLGCGSVVGTGVCLFTGGGAVIGVPVCTATITYGVAGGFVDCVSGITHKVAGYFGASDIMAATEISNNPTVASLVSMALDEACENWKSNN